MALFSALGISTGCDGLGSSDGTEGPSGSPGPPPATTVEGRPILAEEVAGVVGLDFVHDAGADGDFFYVEIMAVGGALFDVDNDGDLDLYAVQGGPVDPRGESGGEDVLFLNQGVDSGGKPSLTRAADFGTAEGYGMGVAAGDFDNDGWTDLYVTRVGANALLRNVQGRRFEDVTALAGVAGNELSSSATFVDLDRDGRLDLYVVNYLRYTLSTDKECTDMLGLREYCGPQSYDPERDRLYRNLGNGRFEDVTESAGIDRSGPGLGVVAGDFDADGWIDLYVANDQASNHLWLNAGAAGTSMRFRDEAMFRGAAVDGRGSPEASMGVDAGDVDGDGDEDLFMTHLIGETNTLYLNDGRGQFTDGSLRFSSGRASLPWTGFGCALMDVDLDGRLDLFVANGAVRSDPKRRAEGDPFPYHEPDLLFVRDSTGDFVDVSQRVEGLEPHLTSRGVAAGDVDNDGDVDWVVFHAGAPLRLFLNQTLRPEREDPAEIRYFGLDLRSTDGSPALGAETRLLFEDGSEILRTTRSGRGYMTAADPRLRFGIPPGAEPVAIEIRWPDGKTERRDVPEQGRYHRWAPSSRAEVDPSAKEPSR